MGAAATEFTLTTNVSAGIKVEGHPGTGTVALSAASGTPSCSGTLDIEEDLGNGDKVKIVGCTAGSATVKLLKDTTELASYTVAVSPRLPPDTASLSPVPFHIHRGRRGDGVHAYHQRKCRYKGGRSPKATDSVALCGSQQVHRRVAAPWIR